MENQIDNFLTHLMNNLTDSMGNTTDNRDTTTDNTTNFNDPSIHYVNRQLDIISNLITQYNTNYLEYQRTTRLIITMLQLNNQSFQQRMRTQHSRPTTQQPRPTTQQPRTNTQHSRTNTQHSRTTMQQPRTSTQQPRTSTQSRAAPTRVPNNHQQYLGGLNSPIINTNITNNASDIWNNIINSYINQPTNSVRRLSQAEIRNATRSYNYENSLVLTESRCPISLDTFVDGDTLIEIRNCHHIFREDNLMRWLDRNTSCPVCRYNLLDTNITNTTNTTAANEEILNTLPIAPTNTGDVYSYTTSWSTPTTYETDSSDNNYNFYNEVLINWVGNLSNEDVSGNVDVSGNEEIIGDLSLD